MRFAATVCVGADVEAQAALNRPAFANELVSAWIPAVPDLQQRLTNTANPARVTDVGCGLGWASIELAKAFPQLVIDGFDSDEESISRARHNASDNDVADRVTFQVVDAANGGYGDRTYDVVFFFECLHDMAHPVSALAAARQSLAPGGTVIVMDERVAESLTEGDPTEIFFATASVLWCLPQGRVDPTSEAPGTVMRPATFETIARRAGLLRRRGAAHRPPVLTVLSPDLQLTVPKTVPRTSRITGPHVEPRDRVSAVGSGYPR